ncbi:Inner membrane transport protein ydhP [Serratia entomophila]|uniref:MFS transporter n=1 Tax=Serratia entomophila TaxID=42906 RepID=UPI001F47F2EC|nr:MFS transporter [Serratia entomophila]UIW17315.1 MFS transporter [Serratia entomophila]CAI0823997.1 Inner membrane transport protein ydhP [Serratia entomophila]CAI0983498.1 Inner membrane transport protein ydhP [Serratia entomophila]CAI1057502.1 Inner membrane transport protein ydhP [Serratia entomophila]CAI1069034.1 Inner membrane transport protein ydhP [Serratia entomophila]
MSSQTPMPRGIWALAATSFAIGVAEFIVVGVLPAIADDLHVSLAAAGKLVGLYALALAIGTPLAVLGLARFPRKAVLLGLVALFFAGNLLSALSASYAMLLVGRMVTAIAHGSFFAIGATVASRLVPKERAGSAIALMFSGLTLAMIIGVPAGSLLGNGMGWRLPFFAVALLSVIAWAATLKWLPALPALEPGKASTQLSALFQPAILAMMSVTILGFGASFAVFTFITPILTNISGFSSHGASLLLIVFGMATLIGNHLGGRLTVAMGWAVALHRMLVLLLVTLIFLLVALPYQYPMVIVLFFWGLLAFGISPGCQTGMLNTAERWAPQAVDFASALNISAFNLGITLGETLGSALVVRDSLALTPWVSVALVLVAQLPLLWLSAGQRRCRRLSNN